MPQRKRREQPSERQREQARFVERAQRTPGVAEAIEAYGRIGHRPVSVQAEIPVVRYSTGANG